MTIDVEQLLRDDATRIAAELARQGTDLPEAALQPRPSVERRPLGQRRALAVAVAMTGVVIVGGVTWTHWPPPRTEVHDAPEGSDDGAIETTPVETTPAETTPVETTPVETTPVANETIGDTTAPSATTAPIGVPLIATGGVAGPVAIDPLPDGYVVTRTQPPEMNSMGDPTRRGWRISLIQLPPVGVEAVADWVVVTLDEIVDGDPYVGFPELADAPDVTIGAFTGRVLATVPSIPLFRAVVGDRVLTVSGHSSMADVEAVIEQLTVDLVAGTVSITAVPSGFTKVADGPATNAMGTAAWVTAYGKDHLTANAVSVWAIADPGSPALVRLTGPMPARLVDIQGHLGVLTDNGLTFDVSPTFQVDLVRDDVPGSESTVSDELLIEMARNVVAVSAAQFDEWTATTRADPYRVTDGPCVVYVDLTTNLGGADVQAITPPATFTVTLTAHQPVASLVFEVIADATTDPSGAARVVLARLDELTDTATVTISWDGTIAGAPAPPGTYLLSLRADPAEESPTACSPDSSLGFGAFTVPAPVAS